MITKRSNRTTQLTSEIERRILYFKWLACSRRMNSILTALLSNKSFRAFVFLYMFSVLGTIWAVAHIDPDNRFLKNFAFNGGDYPYSFVTCEVAYNLDSENLIELRLLIPCRDKRHEAFLKRIKYRIQHDIIMGTDPGLVSQIRAGDLTAYKNALLAIINKKLHRPVEAVYFKSLNTFDLWAA